MGQRVSACSDPFKYYVHKEITKEVVEELFTQPKYEKYKTSLENNGLKFSSEKIASKANEILFTLKPCQEGYEFEFEAVADELNPVIFVHIFKDVFQAKSSINEEKWMLSKTNALRLLTPRHHIVEKCLDNDDQDIQYVINFRHKNVNEVDGMKYSIEDDLHERYTQEEINSFYIFLENHQLEEREIIDLLKMLELVGYCTRNFLTTFRCMQEKLLDAISSKINKTNFLDLFADRTNNPLVNSLIRWSIAQYSYERYDFTPLTLSHLLKGYKKLKECKIDEMHLFEDLLQEMVKKMKLGPDSTEICKVALKQKDKDLKKILDSYFIDLPEPKEFDPHWNELKMVYSAQF